MVKATDPASGLSPSIHAQAKPRVAPEKPIAPKTAPSADHLDAQPESVVVKPGDSLARIAARSHVSLAELRRLNPQFFQEGRDASGRRRHADGRLIYPGDVVHLRATEPPLSSEKVVQAAKAQIDQASNAPASADPAATQAMMQLIPASDPEHGAYQQKVGDILASLNTPSVNPDAAFQTASNAFNTAITAYQANQKSGKPPTDTAQANLFTQALEAYSQAAISVQKLPGGSDKQALQAQLQIMEFTLTQLTAPSLQAGGGATEQPLGPLPDSAPLPPDPTQPAPQPAPVSEQPPTSYTQIPYPGQTSAIPVPPPATPNPSTNTGSPTSAPQGEHLVPGMAVFFPSSPPAPAPSQSPSPNPANAPTNNQASNKTPATPSGPPKKDPNSPEVQQIWNELKQADHKAIRDMAANTDIMSASLPQQKALMVEKLLERWTSSRDEQALTTIVDAARQQGESEDFLKEFDRLTGGQQKGLPKMLDDLNRSYRDQVVKSLFGDPPQGVTFSSNYYSQVAAALDQKDVENLCTNLGTQPGASWLTRLSGEVKQELIQKLKSWWPFGSNSSDIAALTASLTSSPTGS